MAKSFPSLGVRVSTRTANLGAMVAKLSYRAQNRPELPQGRAVGAAAGSNAPAGVSADLPQTPNCTP